MGTIALSLSDWVIKDIIGKQKNKSARAEELLIKAYMAEREEIIKKALSDDGKLVPFWRLELPNLWFQSEPLDFFENHSQCEA